MRTDRHHFQTTLIQTERSVFQTVDKERNLIDLTECIKQYEPSVNLNTFAFHDVMLPYSPTTLKKDKNRMANQKEGFVQVIDGKIIKDI